MFVSADRKVCDNSTVVVKEKCKNLIKKLKKSVTKQIKKIEQPSKTSFPKLSENSKNKTSDIKQVDAPREYILKRNSSIPLGLEENEYKIKLINRPILPELIEALIDPNKIEDTFHQYLTQNKVNREDIDSIEKIVTQMKDAESSDDVVVKLYDLCTILSDENKKHVTNKFIISYLEEQTRIEEGEQDTKLGNLPSFPVKAIEPEPIDVAGKLYSELTKMIFSMGRQSDISDELLADFQAKINSLKQNESAETFTLMLKELDTKASFFLTDSMFKEIKAIFDLHTDMKSELIKSNTQSNVIDDTIIGTVPDDIKTRRKGRMKRLFNAIEWQIFYAVKKIKEIYSDMKKLFHI